MNRPRTSVIECIDAIAAMKALEDCDKRCLVLSGELPGTAILQINVQGVKRYRVPVSPVVVLS